MVLFSILLTGYQFNSGDQTEHLMPLYQLLDKELYIGDFFMNYYHETFSVRTYLIYLLYNISFITGVSIASFLLYFFSTWLIIYSWVKISLYLTGRKMASFLTPFFLIIFSGITLGGNSMIDPSLTSNTPAIAILSLAIYLFITFRYHVSYALVGIASCFHILAGIQIFTILIFTQIFLQYRNEKRLKFDFKSALIFIFFSSPMWLPLLLLGIQNDSSTLIKEQFLETLFIIRAPWHYMPSTFPMKEWIGMSILIIAGIASSLANGSQPVRNLWPFSLVIIVGCGFYYILIEIFHYLPVGLTQWYKTTIWLNAASCVLISGAICQIGKLNIVPAYLIGPSRMIFIVVSTIIILFSSYLPIPFIQGKYQIGAYRESDLQKVHKYIKENTRKDAIFLVSPDNESFSCEAQRPTPVNYKTVIHDAQFFTDWKNKMRLFYGIEFRESKQNILPEAVNYFYKSINQETFDIPFTVVDLSHVNPDTTMWHEDFKSGQYAFLRNVRFEKGFAVRK